MNIDTSNVENSGFTLEEIRILYCIRNYCLELVSSITRIPIAELSKIVWDRELNQNHSFSTEVKRLNRNDFYALREHNFSTSEQDVFGDMSSIEDDFFDSL